MAKQIGKQAKPKCGPGQSCGYACIAAHETCTETIDPTISKAAVEALRSHATAASTAVASESTDFRGKSFAEVQSKFATNDAKHTIMNTIVDHGEGITTQKVTLVASDGSGDTLTHTLLRMAAVPASEGVEAQPERIFTLSDGVAKEYTDAAKHNFWNESRDAAVRAAISQPADKDKAAKPLTAAEAKPAVEAYAKSIGEPKAAEPEPKAAEPEPAEAEPDDEAATSKARNEAIRILRTAAPGDRKKNGWDEDDFVRMFDPQRNPKAAEYWNELQSKDSPAAVRKVQKAWDDKGMKGDNGIKDNSLVELPKLVMMSKQESAGRTAAQAREDRIMNVTNSDGTKSRRKLR